MVTNGAFPYRSSFKLVAVCLWLAEFPLPGVPQVPVNCEEDVGVGAASIHITCHHWHFVCVSCNVECSQTSTQGISLRQQAEYKVKWKQMFIVVWCHFNNRDLFRENCLYFPNWCTERRGRDRTQQGEKSCRYYPCIMRINAVEFVVFTHSPGHLPPRLQWLSGFHLVKVSLWWYQRAPALSLSLHRPLTWRASAHMGRWRSLNPTEKVGAFKFKCFVLKENQWTLSCFEVWAWAQYVTLLDHSHLYVKRTSPPTDQK